MGKIDKNFIIRYYENMKKVCTHKLYMGTAINPSFWKEGSDSLFSPDSV